MDAIKRHSKQREEILRCLRTTTAHPPAQWIYEQAREAMPKLSLGTVYRNLKQLVADGEVQLVGSVRGEERFDGNVQPHPHLVCDGCGAVVDLPADALAGFEGLARLEGHHIQVRRTTFHGTCRACAARRQ